MNIFVKILCILIILPLIWGFFIEPNLLIIRHLTIKDKNLAGLTIAFAGDFHIKPGQQKRLDSIVAEINAQTPDLILLAGDFVNGHSLKSTLSPEKIVYSLVNLKSKYGVYTVLGNHDWWVNGQKLTDLLKRHGINVLENSHSQILINEKTFYIAGVEDIQTRKPDIKRAISGTKNPTILLTHNPDIFPDVPSGVNLTLAGHTHGGQVRAPFIGAITVPSKYGSRYAKGLKNENGKKLFVTSGIGTSILPVRFLCPPEIIVIKFE